MAATQVIFKALSDVTRRRLLRVLSSHELTVSELVEILALPQSTVSRHLKVLREAGLLVDRRQGPAVLYAVHPVPEGPGHNGKGQPARKGAQAGGNGAAGLRDRLIEWVGQSELEGDVADRIARVVKRREGAGAGFFDVTAARWDQLRIEAFGELFHFEALAAVLPMEWVVADIGSGTGYLLPVLSARFRKVIAVDPARRMLDVGRSRPEVRSAGNIEFREGALGRLPLADGEVDLAIVSLVLHHLEQPTDSLGDLRRTLRPGGSVLIVEQQDHPHDEFHERMGDRWRGFEPGRLVDGLGQAGFHDVRCLPLTSVRPHGRARVDAPGLYVVTGRILA